MPRDYISRPASRDYKRGCAQMGWLGDGLERYCDKCGQLPAWCECWGDTATNIDEEIKRHNQEPVCAACGHRTHRGHVCQEVTEWMSFDDDSMEPSQRCECWVLPHLVADVERKR